MVHKLTPSASSIDNWGNDTSRLSYYITGVHNPVNTGKQSWAENHLLRDVYPIYNGDPKFMLIDNVWRNWIGSDYKTKNNQ